MNSGPAGIESTGSADIPEVISLVLECIIGMDIFGCGKKLIMASWFMGPELLKLEK